MFTPPPQSILIFEHVTGGGLAGEPMPESWAVEGAAMRRALAAEFAAGRPAPRVIVALDPRLPDEPGPWRTARVDSIERLEALTREADCTLLIAPETNGVLEGLIRRLGRGPTRLLNASAQAVALAGDKAAMANRLRSRKLPTPRTLLLEADDRPPDDWNYPAVVKPVDGAGSLDTFRIDRSEGFLKLPGRGGRLLLQEFVPGRPLSATFLVRPFCRPRLLAVGEQRVEIVDGRFSYGGGRLPADDLVGLDVDPLAKALTAVPGLEGLVGVDFIHDPGRRRIAILDVNPRPTTSIVGILGLTRPGLLAECWALNEFEDEDEWCDMVDEIADDVEIAGPILFASDGSTFRLKDAELVPVGRKEAGLPPRWLAVDIGGANLKAAHSGGAVKASPFAVWRDPIGLAAALKGLAAGLPPFESIAVTMTAELCDCFETKRDGVRRVVDAVIEAFDVPDLLFWGTDGAFHDHKATLRDPLVAAASNWLGLATVAAGLVGDGPAVLIDVGSTTTDVIPMAASGVAARGRTDTERLRNGELIYAGVSRTPVCALAAELPFQGSPTGLAAELFATTRDVYLVLGDLPGDPGDSSTADGRAATRDRAVDRMARMACADRESCSADDVLDLARAADRALFDRLLASARRACAATIGTPTTAVVSGSGEFLARRIAEALVGPSGTVRSLAELWGPAASDAACARALLELAAKWEAERAGE